MAQYRHMAVISGRGDFPLDMLRYDRAFPESEEDSGTISRTYHTYETWIVKVGKVSEQKGPSAWTVARWQSFGVDIKPLPASKL